MGGGGCRRGVLEGCAREAVLFFEEGFLTEG